MTTYSFVISDFEHKFIYETDIRIFNMDVTLTLHWNESDYQIYMNLLSKDTGNYLIRGKKLVPNIAMNLERIYMNQYESTEFYIIASGLDGDFFKDDISYCNLPDILFTCWEVV